jgi:hypothetical protein
MHWTWFDGHQAISTRYPPRRRETLGASGDLWVAPTAVVAARLPPRGTAKTRALGTPRRSARPTAPERAAAARAEGGKDAARRTPASDSAARKFSRIS